MVFLEVCIRPRARHQHEAYTQRLKLQSCFRINYTHQCCKNMLSDVQVWLFCVFLTVYGQKWSFIGWRHMQKQVAATERMPVKGTNSL